ncbi:LysR family transcriptional regulator [bacterium]|nr:LysR family transcriptional regulator [bacterium]
MQLRDLFLQRHAGQKISHPIRNGGRGVLVDRGHGPAFAVRGALPPLIGNAPLQDNRHAPLFRRVPEDAVENSDRTAKHPRRQSPQVARMLSDQSEGDLWLLKVFAKIIDAGGFSAAQIDPNICQSTISTHMTSLEQCLGMRLCDRGWSEFKLTEGGQLIYQASQRLFQALDPRAAAGRPTVVPGICAPVRQCAPAADRPWCGLRPACGFPVAPDAAQASECRGCSDTGTG